MPSVLKGRAHSERRREPLGAQLGEAVLRGAAVRGDRLRLLLQASNFGAHLVDVRRRVVLDRRSQIVDVGFDVFLDAGERAGADGAVVLLALPLQIREVSLDGDVARAPVAVRVRRLGELLACGG